MRKPIVASLTLAVLVWGSVPASAATEENFLSSTTSDLVALCAADASDPMMTAAVNWCHGFIVGTYRVLALEELKERHKAFCMPASPPNRNDAIAQFVAWAKSNPSQMDKSPSDSVLAFLESKFPCGRAK